MLGKKCLAIGSGKGGVGKSTITVNLAIHAARSGLHVGLVDLDPLSNLHVVLDIPPEALGQDRIEKEGSKELRQHILPLFKNLDLLFPGHRSLRLDPVRLQEALFDTWAKELEKTYDLILLDLPAGINHEENLSFLPWLCHLVIVCNSEPTSHVSAGGYIKAASEINPDLHYYIWHNKFDRQIHPDFDPRDLAGNYNRYVPEDLQLDDRLTALMKDVAFLPHDPSLDLLYAEGEYHHHLLGKFLELATLLDEASLAEIPESSGLPKAFRILIKHFILHRSSGAGYEELIEWLAGLGDGKPPAFNLEQKLLLQKYLLVQNRHPLREKTARMRDVFLQLQEALVSGAMQVDGGTKKTQIQRLSRGAMAIVLEILGYLDACMNGQHRSPWPAKQTPDIKRLAGLLLYYYGFYRLSENSAMQKTIQAFVPQKTDSTGQKVRDRRSQISLLVQDNATYRQKYFELIKRIFPVVQKQILSIAGGNGLKQLVFRSADDKPNHNAYLKLLNRTINDISNSGLGISVGLKFNASAEELRKGAEKVFGEMSTTISERK